MKTYLFNANIIRPTGFKSPILKGIRFNFTANLVFQIYQINCGEWAQEYTHFGMFQPQSIWYARRT